MLRVTPHNPPMSARLKSLAADAVERAVDYLRSCRIRVPEFEMSTDWTTWIGGSHVTTQGRKASLNMGRYLGTFIRDWFAMHELGHVLWACHGPDRRKAFREEFGEPFPKNYDQVHARESWKTPMFHDASWEFGLQRPEGEPSWYGARAGGEERFCELIALMYAHGDFSKEPPTDLARLWTVCWKHGLSRMV